MSNSFKAKILLGLLVVGVSFSKISNFSLAYGMKRTTTEYSSAEVCRPNKVIRPEPISESLSPEALGHEGSSVAIYTPEAILHHTWFEMLKSENIRVLKAIFEQTGGECINWVNGARTPSLNFAVSEGATRSALFLLEHGADINSRDMFERTPLMCALDRVLQQPVDVGYLYFITNIMCKWDPRPDVNLVDIEGNSAWHRVCALGAPDIVDIFKELGGNSELPNHRGQSPQ